MLAWYRNLRRRIIILPGLSRIHGHNTRGGRWRSWSKQNTWVWLVENIRATETYVHISLKSFGNFPRVWREENKKSNHAPDVTPHCNLRPHGKSTLSSACPRKRLLVVSILQMALIRPIIWLENARSTWKREWKKCGFGPETGAINILSLLCSSPKRCCLSRKSGLGETQNVKRSSCYWEVSRPSGELGMRHF